MVNWEIRNGKMGNGTWEIGKQEMGNEKCVMRNAKWEMRNGKL